MHVDDWKAALRRGRLHRRLLLVHRRMSTAIEGGGHPYLVVRGGWPNRPGLVAGLVRHGSSRLGTTRHRERAGPGRVYLDLEDDLDGWNCPAPIRAARARGRRDQGSTPANATPRRPPASMSGRTWHWRRCWPQGVYVVFLSSNQVFDGTRPHRLGNEPTSPQTAYGRQKAEVERRPARQGRDVRCPAADQGGHARIAASERLGRRTPRRGACPTVPRSVIAPLSVSFVVDVIAEMVKCRPAGVLQASGPMDVTYADVALHIARRRGGRPHAGPAPGLIPKPACPPSSHRGTRRSTPPGCETNWDWSPPTCGQRSTRRLCCNCPPF